MRVEPAGHFINWQQDPQANYLARLVFPEKTDEFRVEVDLVAEMSVSTRSTSSSSPRPRQVPFAYDAGQQVELAPYLMEPAGDAAVRRLSGAGAARAHTHDRLPGRAQPAAAARHPLLIRMEPGVQTPEETLTSRAGSCRDSAGCWCSCCAISGWRRASSPAT
jgi:transglutaminase-like putative cysteine protease